MKTAHGFNRGGHVWDADLRCQVPPNQVLGYSANLETLRKIWDMYAWCNLHPCVRQWDVKNIVQNKD